ncbi:hypothetical protein ACLPHD_20305 [Serratia odorifera]|uniref:hypothetical protein n=1 Tax=Serratia odorifera TaxID=618 RepID=UPI003D296407
MKSKSIRFISGEHCIEFYIEFNPLKLANREVLKIDNQVVARSNYSRKRIQNILVADSVLSGRMHQITAISAPKKQGLTQGLQLRIDDEFVTGDKDLVMREEDLFPTYREPLLAKVASNGHPLVRFLKVYTISLVMLIALVRKHEGPDFFRDMSVEGVLLILGLGLIIPALIFPALWGVRKIFR